MGLCLDGVIRDISKKDYMINRSDRQWVRSPDSLLKQSFSGRIEILDGVADTELEIRGLGMMIAGFHQRPKGVLFL